MSITALPTPPTRTDPANFAGRSDAFLSALPKFGNEANALQAEVNSAAAAAAAQSAAALSSSITAQQARDAAQAVANYKGAWASLTGALNIPASVFHANNFWMLTSSLGNVAAAEPGVSSAWQPANGFRGPLPTVRPSLLLDFANSQVLDPRVSFSRASAATRVNRKGLIESVPSGVPRFDYSLATGACLGLLIEEQRANLFTFSDVVQPAGNWGLGPNMLKTGLTVAPDGTFSAGVYTNITAGSAYLVQTMPAAANTTYTMSVYAKLISGVVLTSGCVMVVDYDSDGIPETAERVTRSFEGLTSEWKRFTLTFTNVAASQHSKYVGVDFGNGAEISIWGAQIEVGDFATSYIPSTDTFTSRASSGTFVGSDGLIQTAGADVARLGYNPTNLAVPPKLMTEAAATNLVTYSEQFDNAAWAKMGSSVSVNAAVAPDGATTADKLVESTALSGHSVVQTRTGSNETVTLSCFVKAAERSQVSLSFTNGGQFSIGANFDLKTESVISVDLGNADYASPRASITHFGKGWYRCTLSAAKAAVTTTNTPQISVVNAGLFVYAGNGSSGIYIWGAQVETGTFASSYVATSTTAATRAADVTTSAQTTRGADVATMTGANVTSWLNPVEGTLLVSHTAQGASAALSESQTFVLDGGQAGYLYVRYYSGASAANFDAAIIANGGAQSDFTEAVFAPGVQVTHALAYKTNDAAYARNGAYLETDSTSVVVPVGLTTAYIGSSSGGPVGAQHISRIAYYPERLPNAALQALTA